MRTYEIFMILRPRLSEEDVNTLVTSFERSIAEHTPGASVTGRSVERDKFLSYPIGKERTGHVVQLEIEASGESELAAEPQQVMQRAEDVLRYLVFKKPEGAPAASQPVSVIDSMRNQQARHRRESIPGGARRKREIRGEEAVRGAAAKPAGEKEKMDVAAVDKRIEELLQ